jgi:hypothetical protein
MLQQRDAACIAGAEPVTTTRWQHSVVLTRKMQRSGNSMRIALTAPQQQQQHNGDDDANAIMQWHLSFMIIDCAPLWRWLMLEVAMVFVIVGGCIFFEGGNGGL